MKLANFDFKTVTGVCDIHGEWEQEIFTFAAKHASCPTCNKEKAAEEEKNEIAKRRKDYHHNRLAFAGIPKRFKNKSLDNYESCPRSRKAYEACKRYSQKLDWVQENGTSLIFCGKPGTGKTHLSIGIMQEAIRKGVDVRYSTVIEMIRDVKDTYSRGAEKTEKQVIDYFSSISILVLDEVGMQIGSDTEKLILSEIINNRYADIKPTILISNLGISELKAYLGDRIFDRMKEGGGTVFAFDWESKRGAL